MKLALALLLWAYPAARAAAAAPRVTLLPANAARGTLLTTLPTTLRERLAARFAADAIREIKAQPVFDGEGKLAYLLVQLFSRRTHRLELVRVDVDAELRFRAVVRDYEPSSAELEARTAESDDPQCPDDTVEFIALCPNGNAFEQGITREVAAAARARGLVTVELIESAATRQAWLDYMSCPKLRGNFYDGDSTKSYIAVFDGLLSYKELRRALTNRWNHAVTNLWVACRAYNDPMLSVVQRDAQAKKYAAGVNDLIVGPADTTALCAIRAWLEGAPMGASFEECYRKHDVAEDRWGFGGDGSDRFW